MNRRVCFWRRMAATVGTIHVDDGAHICLPFLNVFLLATYTFEAKLDDMIHRMFQSH